MFARAAPKSHSHTELIRSSRDSIGHHAVDADARKERGKQAEHSGKLRYQPLIRHRTVHDTGERDGVAHREIRIDRMHGSSDFWNQEFWVTQNDGDWGIVPLYVRLFPHTFGMAQLPE